MSLKNVLSKYFTNLDVCVQNSKMYMEKKKYNKKSKNTVSPLFRTLKKKKFQMTNDPLSFKIGQGCMFARERSEREFLKTGLHFVDKCRTPWKTRKNWFQNLLTNSNLLFVDRYRTPSKIKIHSRSQICFLWTDIEHLDKKQKKRKFLAFLNYFWSLWDTSNSVKRI